MGPILITGGFGFIGSALVRRLLGEGHRVELVELGSADGRRLQDQKNDIAVHGADIADTRAVEDIVRKTAPELIIHLATYYAVDHRPDELGPMVRTNVLGVSNLLEAARLANVRYFINTSSCFVYEQHGRPLREEGPFKPGNYYAATKRFSEELCDFYAENHGLNAATLRIFSPYGPADHQRRLIPSVIASYLAGKQPRATTGRQAWDFVYIDDIVEAYLKAIAHRPTGHEVFNIGSGKAVAVRDIILRIKEILGSDLEPLWGSVPHRKNEIWSMTADISKAGSVLGWEPATDLIAGGLERTVRWFAGQQGGMAR